MVFKEMKWDNISDESQLYKKQVNGFNDPCLKEYNPLLVSALFKDEYKKDQMTKEYIRSFMEAAKSLAKAQSANKPGMTIFYDYSLILPALYLCRHSAEMAIKYSLESLHIEYKNVHKLKELWDKLIEAIPKGLQSGKERTIVSNMGFFINKLNDLDENGQRLRYAIQTSGDLSQDIFLWINIQNIVNSTEKFIKQILDIDADNILKNKIQ